MRANLFILTVLSIMLLFSCKSEIDTLISVQLNPTFLTLSEGSNEPMKVKSATADTVQVYAVQVYQNDAPYYYGLFTDVSKMQIALTTSKTYKFKVTAYKAGTGKGLKTLTDADGVNYYLPTKLAVKNAFVKGDLLKDIDSPTAINLSGQQKDFVEADAFYATKSVTVEKGTTTIDFSLLRMGFGINFTVDALTSGNMEIYLGNDTIKLNSTKTTAHTVRQFNKATNNFTDIHSKAETFGDSIAISAKWTSASGTTVTASGKYKFLRNYQKTINIQLNTLTNSVTFEGWNTVTDVDGNVYKTVKIGNQIWMAENLRVTHYRDGAAIPNVTSNSAWAALTTGAYCDYNNNIVNGSIYGHLYNWFAISDSRNIAPEGWHVPTNAEWTTLINSIGGTSFAGGKLKEIGTTRWLSPNTGATDSYGFKALPSGNRKYDAVFDYIGFTADFWTSTEATTANAWYVRLYSTSTNVDIFSYGKLDGFAVRCIKD